MDNLSFKQWLIEVGAGGGGPGSGLEPPKQSPVDPDPSPGQTHAFHSVNIDKSDLPPTPSNPKMKKRMKKMSTK